MRADAFTYLANPQKLGFDLIYVAPPQYKQMWQKAILLIDKLPELLDDDGQVIVQINPIEWEELDLSNLTVFDSRNMEIPCWSL